MRRIAAHRVFWKQAYPMSYVETTDEGVFMGVYPLNNEETPHTEFYDGLLLPVPQGSILATALTEEQILRSGISEHISPGDKIHLYRFHREAVYRHL
jgi:hypothetical protein